MNIRTSAFRGLAVLSLTAFGLAACEDKIELPEPTPPAVEVTVAPTQVEIPVGGTASAAAVVKNSTNQAVTWTSANQAVATVSATGQITAVAPGSTVITATSAADANAKGLVSVTVVAPTVTLTLLPQTAQVTQGGNITLQATVSGAANQAVTCATSAPAVATVAAGTVAGSCVVTAVAPGTAVITATSAANTNAKNSSVITVVPVTSTVRIALQPATATTTIGGKVQLVPQVTGTTNTAVTYRSSAEGVATVSGTGEVTGVSGGTAVITAIAAADTLQKATTVITVSGAPPEPSISIASIIDNDEGTPINPDNVEGQVDVTINVSAVPENDVRAVVLYVTSEADSLGTEVCRQNFANPLGTTQGVATINCPVNTADLDEDGAPVFVNGEYTFVARALTSSGATSAEAEFCPGGDCVVDFVNVDVVGIELVFDNGEDPESALDQNGLRWQGGSLTVNVRPALFSGSVAASLNATLSCDEGDAFAVVGSVALELEDGVWTYTWDEEDLPGTYEECVVNVGSGTTEAGDEIDFDTDSEEFRLDNEAPEAFVADLPQTVLDNNNYAGATTSFATSNLQGIPDPEDADEGVDRVTFQVYAVPSGAVPGDAEELEEAIDAGDAIAVTSASQLPESTIENDVYQLLVVATDALGNQRFVGTTNSFGVDLTLPTIAIQSASAANNSTNPTAELLFNITDTFSGPQVVRVRQSVYSVLEVDADAGTEVQCLNNAGALSNAPASGVCPVYTHAVVDVANNTTDTANIALPNAVAVEGYIVTTVWSLDRAGNVSADSVTRTVLMDLTAPTGTIDQYTVVTATNSIQVSGTIRENVDLASYDVRYNFPTLSPLPDQIPFTTATTVDAYGLPLTGVVTVNGQNAVNVREVRIAAEIVSPTSVGFGAWDVAGNFGFVSQPLAFGGGGNGTGLVADDATPGGANTFGLTLSPNLYDRSSATTGTINALVQVGPTDANPLARVYFYYVHPGALPADPADDYFVLIGTTTTAAVQTGVLERTFTFSLPATVATWPTVNGAYQVVALGVDAEGDALFSDIETVTLQD